MSQRITQWNDVEVTLQDDTTWKVMEEQHFIKTQFTKIYLLRQISETPDWNDPMNGSPIVMKITKAGSRSKLEYQFLNMNRLGGNEILKKWVPDLIVPKLVMVDGKKKDSISSLGYKPGIESNDLVWIVSFAGVNLDSLMFDYHEVFLEDCRLIIAQLKEMMNDLTGLGMFPSDVHLKNICWDARKKKLKLIDVQPEWDGVNHICLEQLLPIVDELFSGYKNGKVQSDSTYEGSQQRLDDEEMVKSQFEEIAVLWDGKSKSPKKKKREKKDDDEDDKKEKKKKKPEKVKVPFQEEEEEEEEEKKSESSQSSQSATPAGFKLMARAQCVETLNRILKKVDTILLLDFKQTRECLVELSEEFVRTKNWKKLIDSYRGLVGDMENLGYYFDCCRDFTFALIDRFIHGPEKEEAFQELWRLRLGKNDMDAEEIPTSTKNNYIRQGKFIWWLNGSEWRFGVSLYLKAGEGERRTGWKCLLDGGILDDETGIEKPWTK